ncbi:hypothetical protein TPHA_0A00890 [Tetrapisispora phaffii CBS 4417]|uniref:Inositol polyphosphate-related phosphatase domain-containing protein n=1 Tax=Tetrapisispora phaffii (strain ATCC 24235 / CBS 4417 / NBRC 1672 / NRRL Y-8282 / UCD 70-5) TaxID=1071381 RepID=G8BMP6_TETPH|nr:hypothetical protein TPHA_0A00890 [Tetrapisispora phaffii CBS 4417]CCE61174.1 hypothetical protein TPHA_0A00890 [Tetrapisispora phaffii CBS 4417]
MNDWKISVTTFNCGKKYPVDNSTWSAKIIKECLAGLSDAQDIYVFGFQEFVPLWEGSFHDTVSSYLDEVASTTIDILSKQFNGKTFKSIGSHSLGAIALLVIASNTVIKKSSILSVECSRGLLGSNLKGGIAISVDLANRKENHGNNKETFTFINTHLAANEGMQNASTRIDDINCILNTCDRELRMTNFKNGHLFVLGDMNFRLTNINKDASQLDFTDAVVIQELLKNNDELNLFKLISGFIFSGFIEPTITFAPTYKYKIDCPDEYNYKRTPSWCDRILFKEYGNADKVKIINYNSIARADCLQFTDHQPVTLSLSIPTTAECTQLTLPDFIQPEEYYKVVGSILNTSVGYSGWLLSFKYSKLIAIVLLVIWTVWILNAWK